MPAVVLVETREAVGQYHAWLRSVNEEDIVPVARSPLAECALERSGTEFTRPAVGWDWPTVRL